jgi:hypothetical protein
MANQQPKLKVIAVDDKLVLDDVAAANNTRRYVGRAIHAPQGKDGPAQGPVHELLPALAGEYPDNAEYAFIKRAVQKGDLKPCDEYTARRCGVAFQSREPARKKGD